MKTSITSLVVVEGAGASSTINEIGTLCFAMVAGCGDVRLGLNKAEKKGNMDGHVHIFDMH